MEEIAEGDKFICIYDQTYGSLRLSGRILEKDVFKLIWNKSVELAQNDENLGINLETIEILKQINNHLLLESPINLSFETEQITNLDTNRCIKVIIPGSKGLDVKKDNEEFFVEGVFYSPIFQGIAYRGKYLSQKNSKHDATTSIPIDRLKEIPGESKIGLYNIETGEIK